ADFGLVQCLAGPDQEFTAFVWPTRIPAVDYFPGGGPRALAEGLPNPAMHDLLNRMCHTYHRILIVGPPLSQTLETELLSGYVDGIIVTVRGSSNAIGPGVEDFIHHLQEANAPLMGAVVAD